MRKITAFLILCLFPALLWAAEPKADKIRIDDAGSLYTSTNVEGALQEISNGTSLNSTYKRLDNNNTFSDNQAWNQSIAINNTESFDAVWRHSNAAYTNNTAAAKTTRGATFTFVGKADSDSTRFAYIGRDNITFSSVGVDMATTSAGMTLTFEYWNGTAWNTTTVTDGTTNLTADGVINFTAPGDWTQIAFNTTFPNVHTPPDTTSRYWFRIGSSTVETTAGTAYIVTPSDGSDMFTVTGNAGDVNGTVGVNYKGLLFLDDLTAKDGTIDLLNAALVHDDTQFSFGDGTDSKVVWETTGNDSLQIGLVCNATTDSGYVSLMESSDMGDADRSPTSITENPTIRIYSANESNTTDYVDIFHDGLGGRIIAGNGQLNISNATVDSTLTVINNVLINATAPVDAENLTVNGPASLGYDTSIGNGSSWINITDLLGVGVPFIGYSSTLADFGPAIADGIILVDNSVDEGIKITAMNTSLATGVLSYDFTESRWEVDNLYSGTLGTGNLDVVGKLTVSDSVGIGSTPTVVTPAADNITVNIIDTVSEAERQEPYGILVNITRTPTAGNNYSIMELNGGVRHGATIGTMYGLKINSMYDSGGVGSTPTAYGLFVDSQPIGSTSNYTIYANGTGWNYMGGRLGLGTVTPSQSLDIIGNAISISTSEANTTTKVGYLASRHYNTSEEQFGILGSATTASQNVVAWGGGNALWNAATDHLFYTAADNNVLTGTQRLKINKLGNVSIGAQATNPGLFSIDGGTGGTAYQWFTNNATSGLTSTDGTYLGINATDHFFIKNQESNTDIRLNINDGGVDTNAIWIDADTSRLGIWKTLAPAVALDVVGRMSLASTETDLASKFAYLITKNYNNSNASVMFFFGASSSDTESSVKYGGGSGSYRAVTEQYFYTAPNASTLTGLVRMKIDRDGLIGIGTEEPESILDINSETGNCLKLIYNDADGAPVYYGNFTVNDTGDLGIKASGGDIILGGTAGTNNEDMTLDFESTANYCKISSTTGVTHFQFQKRLAIVDNQQLVIGSSGDSSMGWTTIGNDNLQMGLLCNNAAYSGYYSLMEAPDLDNTNRSPAAVSVNPVLRIYSSDVAEANDYIEFTHDQTDGRINVGNGDIIVNQEIRTNTSLYRRYYHLPLSSANPGASGATWTAFGANNLNGWQLNAAGETLDFEADVHADWDNASNVTVEMKFQLLDAGSAGDTVDLKLVAQYMGVGDTATKTQTVEVATVTDGTQYKMYQVSFPLNYTATSNVIDVNDSLDFKINLETDTSEIDNVLITDGSLYYQTNHTYIEAGDV